MRRFLPLARKLARRYYGGGEPLEDLVQVANVGLLKAVNRFDEHRQVSFYERLELDESEVVEAQAAYTAFSAASLDEPVAHYDDGTPQVRLDTLGHDDESFELAEARVTVAPKVRELSSEERRVLHMRFVEDRTRSDIANRIGVSQMQVSRILRRTLDKLRRNVERTPEWR